MNNKFMIAEEKYQEFDTLLDQIIEMGELKNFLRRKVDDNRKMKEIISDVVNSDDDYFLIYFRKNVTKIDFEEMITHLKETKMFESFLDEMSNDPDFTDALFNVLDNDDKKEVIDVMLDDINDNWFKLFSEYPELREKLKQLSEK